MSGPASSHLQSDPPLEQFKYETVLADLFQSSVIVFSQHYNRPSHFSETHSLQLAFVHLHTQLSAMLYSSSITYALALLPLLAVARPNPELYEVTIGGQETAFDLPPFTAAPPEPSPAVEAAPAPVATDEAPAGYGTTIPVSIAGQETSVVLPTFEAQPTGATVLIPVVPAPTVDVSSISSAVSEIAETIATVASSISAEAASGKSADP